MPVTTKRIAAGAAITVLAFGAGLGLSAVVVSSLHPASTGVQVAPLNSSASPTASSAATSTSTSAGTSQKNSSTPTSSSSAKPVQPATDVTVLSADDRSACTAFTHAITTPISNVTDLKNLAPSIRAAGRTATTAALRSAITKTADSYAAGNPTVEDVNRVLSICAH